MGDYERQTCKSIGIHLGTKFSSICVWRVRMDGTGLLKIIRDSLGNERIPNFVAFIDSDEILIGQEAKDQVLDNLANTIFDLKRLIGRKYADPTVQSSIKFWPFQVVAGNHDKAMIVVRHKGIENLFSPEEILSLILMRLKDIVEESGLKNVTNVVITVPTFFNDSQRQATKDSAKLAGLNVLRLINESSAVAYSYGYYKKSILVNDVKLKAKKKKKKEEKKKEEKNLMVFYLGSGCLDVSMLNVNEEWTRYEVIGVAGDTQLGEIDFDRGIVCHCLDDIKRQKRMDEIKNTDTRMRRLINACEEFNQNLGADNKYEIELDSFYPDENSFTCTITRTAFEVLNRKLFDRCVKAVEECLHVSKVTGCYDIFNAECNYVQEVILAGAGSQLIRPLLEEIFNGKKHISEGIDPYTAVVQGAAIQAAILSAYGAVGKFDNFSLFEVTPSRLAIDDSDITLVPRNTKFPGKFSTSFTSSINRASDCSIGIREIEREGTDSRDYHRLGKFNLHIEPPSSAVVLPLELGCAVDINRIFSISHIKDKNLKHKVTWGSNTERFTAEEMDDMLRTAEEIRTSGNQVKRGKQVKRLLEMFVHEFFPEHGGSSVLCKDLDPGALRKIQEVSGWLLARSKQVLRVEDYNSKFDEINEASPGSTEFFKNVGAKCSFKDGMKDYLDCLELHADYYDSLLHEKLIKYCGKSLKWVDSDQLFAAAEYEGRWEKFWEKITSYEFAKKLYLESKRRAGEML